MTPSACVPRTGARAALSSCHLPGSPRRLSSASRAARGDRPAQPGRCGHGPVPALLRRVRAPAVADRRLVVLPSAPISERCIHAWLMPVERCPADDGAQASSAMLVRPPSSGTTRRAAERCATRQHGRLCSWTPVLVDRLVDRPLYPLAAANSAWLREIFCAACPQPPARTVGE
jgi:hypothetical protein